MPWWERHFSAGGAGSAAVSRVLVSDTTSPRRGWATGAGAAGIGLELTLWFCVPACMTGVLASRGHWASGGAGVWGLLPNRGLETAERHDMRPAVEHAIRETGWAPSASNIAILFSWAPPAPPALLSGRSSGRCHGHVRFSSTAAVKAAIRFIQCCLGSREGQTARLPRQNNRDPAGEDDGPEG